MRRVGPSCRERGRGRGGGFSPLVQRGLRLLPINLHEPRAPHRAGPHLLARGVQRCPGPRLTGEGLALPRARMIPLVRYSAKLAVQCAGNAITPLPPPVLGSRFPGGPPPEHCTRLWLLSFPERG